MPTERRPNILWVSFEDTNPFYGCYGDRTVPTPNLDALAAQGCLWTHGFSTAGVCAPARSAVITGMYPTAIGTHHMRTTYRNAATPELPTPYAACVPHYVKCLPEYLRAAGYFCTNNAKTDYQFDAPFTAWDELGGDAHWRRRPDPDQPFFAVFNPTRTHESGMWSDKAADPSIDQASIELPPYFPDTPVVRESMARMYTHIARSDAELGERLAELEADGLADNTIVVHWSDHGPLPRGKRWPYDSGIHVPLIARWPGRLGPGTVSDRLVSTVDLAPSMLSAAGLPIPKHMQGRAFLGAQEAPARRTVFAARDRYDESYDMVRAARDRRFKYIRNGHPELPYLLWIQYRNRHPIMQELWRLHLAGELKGAQRLLFEPRPVEELYDCDADPWETRNLADDPRYAAERERLSAELDAWMAATGDLGLVPESEMVRRWYPNGVQPRTASPVFVPICAASPGIEPGPRGGTFAGPMLLQLHSATQGASIGYRFEGDPDGRWRLYANPVRLEEGRTTVRAKAIRIGYAESAEVRATFEVTR